MVLWPLFLSLWVPPTGPPYRGPLTWGPLGGATVWAASGRDRFLPEAAPQGWAGLRLGWAASALASAGLPRLSAWISAWILLGFGLIRLDFGWLRLDFGFGLILVWFDLDLAGF